jgi:MinD superfamily P-loop ATPase
MKIAIASGKGGTGKTLVSTNLASYISKLQPVLLADLDVEEPNDSLFIGYELTNKFVNYKNIPLWNEQSCTLCGLCSSVCKFHAVVQLGPNIMVFNELCHSCYACSELCPTQSLPMTTHRIGETSYVEADNFIFVESRLKTGEEQAVPLIHQAQAFINEKFGDTAIQIFDCPPGTTCPVIAATREADYVMLVTEPTPFGLNDLKLAVETMRSTGKKIGVIINRYNNLFAELEQYCEVENIPVIARIPVDREIAQIYSRGKLAWKQIPALSDALANIVDHLKQQNQTI